MHIQPLPLMTTCCSLAFSPVDVCILMLIPLTKLSIVGGLASCLEDESRECFAFAFDTKPNQHTPLPTPTTISRHHRDSSPALSLSLSAFLGSSTASLPPPPTLTIMYYQHRPISLIFHRYFSPLAVSLVFRPIIHHPRLSSSTQQLEVGYSHAQTSIKQCGHMTKGWSDSFRTIRH